MCYVNHVTNGMVVVNRYINILQNIQSKEVNGICDESNNLETKGNHCFYLTFNFHSKLLVLKSQSALILF